jgi:hypothetical protein
VFEAWTGGVARVEAASGAWLRHGHALRIDPRRWAVMLNGARWRGAARSVDATATSVEEKRRGARPGTSVCSAVPATGKTGEHMGGGGSVREKKVVVLGRPDERYPLIFIQKNPNRFALIRSKYDSPILEKFQIKYKFVGNKIMNNFPYSNFLKFRIEFELKIREDSRC